MDGSSPARRSVQSSSPERLRYGSYLSPERNNLTNHHDALTASKEEHDRVRDHAIRALEKHTYQLEQLRIQDEESRIIEKQKREKARLEQEQRLRDEEQRLRDLEAQKVPKLPPKPAAESIPAVTNPDASGTNGVAKGAQPTGSEPSNQAPTAPPLGVQPKGTNTRDDIPAAATSVPPPTLARQQENVPKPSPFSSSTTPSATSALSPFAAANKPAASPFGKPVAPITVNGLGTSTPSAASSTPALVTAPIQAVPSPDRYVEIHQSLKKLRAMVKQQMTTNVELKKHAGNMRREIRKSIGQLTGEKGANRQQLAKIRDVLTMALQGQPSSVLVDPAEFVRDQREPVPDADMIKQFDGECGPMPDKADPIGVNAAQVFSTREYLWRGKSMIDIMMAKFRIACPALFGIRGNEKMEQGRLRLGWRKPDGQWEPEQQHFERMSGLAVGYASIALRDFSKAKTTNPYPPSNYWTSFAKIVNTPPAEISDTQCVVLRAMIYLYEEKFIGFYGNQAMAALRRALIEFPEKANRRTPAVTGLTVLASLYQKDLGLDLR